METGALVDTTRKMMADFFNGNDPNRLCFSYNSTDALNLIIFGILQQGDHAITTTLEHNSVLRPLYHQNKLNGVEVVAFTGHKSLLGPTGIGGLYVREGIEIRHTRAGGTGIRSAERMHLDDYPYRLEYGTGNIDGMEALNTGTLLDGEYDIACRTGLHCAPLAHEQLGTDQIGGTVRMGIGPFNTEEHINTAIQAVAEIADFQKKSEAALNR